MAIHLLSTGRASFSPIEDHANFRNYKKDTVYISFFVGQNESLLFFKKFHACSKKELGGGGCKKRINFLGGTRKILSLFLSKNVRLAAAAALVPRRET